MILTIILTLSIALLLRVIYLIQSKGKKLYFKDSARTLIVIGSGGHTHEMLKQVKSLNPNLYKPRLYVMADSDLMSGFKINEVEAKFKQKLETSYSIVKIPRSRSVNQSYFTSIFTTIHSTVSCIPVVFTFKPDLILCNGPGTCVPVCIIGFLLNVFLFSNTKIVFVESICRVKTLSLSGKILLHFADSVIVQWLELHKRHPETVYLGRLA